MGLVGSILGGTASSIIDAYSLSYQVYHPSRALGLCRFDEKLERAILVVSGAHNKRKGKGRKEKKGEKEKEKKGKGEKGIGIGDFNR
jgi:hypothetical protein